MKTLPPFPLALVERAHQGVEQQRPCLICTAMSSLWPNIPRLFKIDNMRSRDKYIEKTFVANQPLMARRFLVSRRTHHKVVKFKIQIFEMVPSFLLLLSLL
jgi:hypothetical protein